MTPNRLARAGTHTPWRRRLAAGALVLSAVSALLGGCASVPAGTGAASAARPAVNPIDPWERFNRQVFAFNDVVDEAVLTPVAKAYKAVVPELVREGFGNVLSNVGDLWSAVQHLLQGKPQQALESGMRVGVNTVFGIGGLFDVASEAGLERQSEDLGQTLGRWGFGTGPYLVLPFLGPSDLRDSLAFPIDRQASLSSLLDHVPTRNSLSAVELIHTRAGLLGATSVLGQVALDRYSFVRDAYLARRRSLVFDGNPPPEERVDDEPPAKPPAKAESKP